MGGVRTYGPFSILSSGDMSGDLQSLGVDMLSLPYGAVELVWTGTPTGTFSIDGSIDNVKAASSVVNWYPTGTAIDSPAGASGSTLVNLTGIGFRWIRVSYVSTSGSGSLNITLFGKGIGSGSF